MTARDPYQVLGVSRRARADEIHAAYRRLAKRHHPDLNPGDPHAEGRFREIADAYAVLSDAARRAALDNELGAGGVEGQDAWPAGSRAGYSPERGYEAGRNNGRGDQRRAMRAKRPRRAGWLAAIGLWIILCFVNSVLRGAETALDGTVVATQSVPVPIGQVLLVQGPRGLYARTTQYTIRRADGGTEIFLAGSPCSLLFERPRTGASIHKEAWRLSYELNGRSVSDFSGSSVSCVTYIPFNLLIAICMVAVGLQRRSYP